MICQGCDSIYHSECTKPAFKFDHVRKFWICHSCNSSDRYNPFNSTNFDKHESPSSEFNEDIQVISNILKSCHNYDKDTLNNLSHDIREHSKPCVSVVFNNIDGNASNFDHFVADLSQYRERFDVIAVAETNVSAEHKDLYQIRNYSSEYNSKAYGKNKGSGLAIYISNEYQFTRIEKFCRQTANIEALFVELTNCEVPQIVGVIYRPPSGNLPEACKELEALMKILPCDNVTVTGDFNIDLLSTSSDSAEFEQIIYSNNLIPLISIATHEKPGCKATLIDNILVNSTENILKSGVLESMVSHHKPIFAFLSCKKKSRNNLASPNFKYDYCETNMQSFLSEIYNEVFLVAHQFDENGFEKFVSKVNEKIESNFKTEISTQNKSKRNRLMNPWITSGIINSVCTKYYLYRSWKASCSKKFPLGESSLYQKYKEYRSSLCKIIKSAKKKYYVNKFDLAKGNIKKTWELINELRGKSKSDIKASFIIDGRIITDRREIANNFNIFFSSIARKLNSKVQSSMPLQSKPHDTCSFRKYLKQKQKTNMNAHSIFLSPCDDSEIDKIIREFENGKASDISLFVLKKCSHLISGHLSDFFSKFLENGIFPENLKRGSVTPIYKKGDPRYLDNYRPVSTLPIFGKILEKVIYNRLYDYFTATNALYDRQFGFRKMHSTSHAINYSVDYILKEIERKNHVIGIFIDLSKAFDTIEHEKLLEKLSHYGIRGPAHDILKSYLSRRQQVTKFLREESDACFMEFGVPQGSVLGPLLFLIYINDIVASSSDGEFVLFADDTNIFVIGKTAGEAYKRANSLLSDISDYMILNQLHINVAKSCYIHFRPDLSRAQQTCARANFYDRDQILYLGDSKLQKVQSTKFLGVVIDEQLSWEPHIDYLESKLNSCLVTIKRIKSYIPRTEYLNIYNALFMSHLTYCISCWGGVPDYKLGKIFSIQKRCIRLLFGKSLNFDHKEYYETCARIRTIDQHREEKTFCLEHTKPIFNEHCIMSLGNLYVYHTFMQTFKVLKFSTPISTREMITFLPRNDKLTLAVPLVKLNVSQQNFAFKASKIWNEVKKHIFEPCSPCKNGIIIPGSTENSDLSSSTAFVKHKLKNHLLSMQKSGDLINW